MIHSHAWLRRALLAVAAAGSLGFGATQALAGPQESAARTCPARGYEYPYASCGFGCPGGRGYCGADGICRCGLIP
ncbi:MAG TPA: hypothetical protein VFR81_06830 [Longimicrobium sp.]|nr:hypothetical protein [Longimicrobium sp.]